MNLYARGLAWVALYVALVLLPAAVAVLADPIAAPRPALLEVSVALGLLAYPLVMIQMPYGLLWQPATLLTYYPSQAWISGLK